MSKKSTKSKGRRNRIEKCLTCGLDARECHGHKKTNWKLLIVILVIMTILVSYSIIKNGQKNSNLNVATTNYTGPTNNEIILQKLVQTPVSNRYFPVFMYLNGEDLGCGTAYSNSEGQWNVVTASHLFRRGRTGVFSFRLMSHPDKKLYYVNTAVKVPTSDVVICTSGESKTIVGFSDYNDWWGRIALLPRKTMGKKLAFTSLTTGKTYECVGTWVPDTEPLNETIHTNYALIAYDGIPGESGEGFIEEHGNIFFVLAAKINAHQIPTHFAATLQPGDIDKLMYGYLIAMP